MRMSLTMMALAARVAHTPWRGVRPRALAAGVAFLLLATAAGAAPSHQRAVLPNGLTVIAVQDASSAVGAFHLAVRVNPESVPRAQWGVLALSQQTLQVALRDLYKQEPWRALGEDVQNTRAVLSTNTEPDYAEVRCQLAAPSLPLALQLAGKLAFGGVPATSEQVTTARDALSNVVADAGENMLEATYYRLLRAFHGNQSPLARPVVGTDAALAALGADEVHAFRSTFLGPNNASLCVIGPYPPARLIELAREAMGSYPASKTTSARPPTPALPAESRVSVASLPRWRAASVMVGVGVPPYGTAGYLQAQLIYTLLDGPQGRVRSDRELNSGLGLNRIMGREGEQPPVAVLAPMAAPRPLLIMHMVTAPRLMETARAALLGHFLAFATRAPQPAELDAGKQRLINAYAMMQLSRLNLAKELNCYEVYGQDYARAWSAPDLIRQITAEDLQKLARDSFQTHAVGLLMPGDEPVE